LARQYPVETIPVPFAPDGLAVVDAWNDRQGEEVSRSEAIRRLVEQALAAAPKLGRKD
jgi:hypothetical protein